MGGITLRVIPSLVSGRFYPYPRTLTLHIAGLAEPSIFTNQTPFHRSTLTGIPIAGQILAANRGEYWGLILFTGMCYVGGLVSFIAARVLQVGWKITAIY